MGEGGAGLGAIREFHASNSSLSGGGMEGEA